MAIVLPFYKTPNISIKTSIQAVGALPSIQATIACIGHRSLEGEETALAPLVPAPGYPTLQNYFPFTMPPFGSGYEALEYMVNLGFTVNYGLSGTLTFPGPDDVTVNTNGTVTLSYDAMPLNYNLLLQSGISATVAQSADSATGTFLSASATSYAITVGTVTGTFADTPADVVTLAYINNSLGLPDPNRTEEICMQVFYIYQVMNLIKGGAQYNFIKPNVVLSVLTNRDAAFGPNAASLAIGTPAATSVQTDGSVYLGFTAVPANAAYIPLQQLGNSTLNQATSLGIGVILGVLAPYTIADCAYVVHVATPSGGPFDTTHAITLHLDAAETVFVLMENSPSTAVVNPYNVSSNTDITTNQVQFFDFINQVNAPSYVEQGFFGTFGVFANTTIPAQSAQSSLPTDVNYNWYAPVYYPYQPLVGEYPQSSAIVAAAVASFFSCNSSPYNPQSNVVIPALLSSANTQNRVTLGLNGVACSEVILDLGWSPLCVNPASQVFPARLITGQTTLPQTNVEDIEFFPITTWQIVTYFQQQIYVALITAGVKQLRQSPQILTKVKGVIIGLMTNFQTLGMFENVAQLAKQVTVTQSNIPDTILIQVPVTVIPELASANVQVGLISSTFTFG